MAALTASTTRRYRSGGFSWHQNWRVSNNDVIYIGSFCGIPGADALTSRRGYVDTYSDEQTIQWVGPCIRTSYESAADRDNNRVTGDTSASPVPEAWTEAGPIVLEQVTVTGVSAQADVRLAVYASNDNDLTVTASQSPVIGRVVYWYSGTTVDVLAYGYLASVVI